MQENLLIWVRVPFQSEDHFSLHWPCSVIISLPFCHRSRHVYALKNLQKLISLLDSVSLLDSFVDPSPTDSSGGSSDGSTGLPACFHWHQFYLKCGLLGSGYSLKKYACPVLAAGLPEKRKKKSWGLELDGRTCGGCIYMYEKLAFRLAL